MKKERFFVEPRRTQARILHCSAYSPDELLVLASVIPYQTAQQTTAQQISRSLNKETPSRYFSWQFINAILERLERFGLIIHLSVKPRCWIITSDGKAVRETTLP